MANDPLIAVEKDIQKVYTFTKSHIVMAIVIAVLAFGLSYEWSSYRAAQADARAAVSHQEAVDSDKLNAQTQATNLQLQAQLTEQINQAVADRKQQQAFVVTILNQLKQQQAKDVTLAPSDLSARHGQLVGSAGPTVSGNTFISDLPLEQKTVVMLEQVPALQQEVDKKQNELNDADVQLTKTQDKLSSEQNAHVQDNQTCAVDKRALNDEITKVKADASKQKKIWLAIGTVLGWIGRGVLGGKL